MAKRSGIFIKQEAIARGNGFLDFKTLLYQNAKGSVIRMISGAVDELVRAFS